MRTSTMQLTLFPEEEIAVAAQKPRIVNVASVPKRSPFRYPGGKTWLVPTIRKWFSSINDSSHLIEPFAGGGIISLTAAAEHYFNHITMVELDEDIAATWQTIFSNDHAWLTQQIANFHISAENIKDAVSHSDEDVKHRGFATIVRNRTNHGGILAKGSGQIKTGENGRGLASRWYPDTIITRINEAYRLRNIITFIHGDAFDIIERYTNDSEACFFIDPPYTVAGRRLYNLHQVDHQRIFELCSKLKGHFLMTYDNTPEVEHWAKQYHLPYTTIPMQTTHLVKKEEMLIADDLSWLNHLLEYKKARFEAAV